MGKNCPPLSPDPPRIPICGGMAVVLDNSPSFQMYYLFPQYPAVRRNTGDFIIGMFFVRDFFELLEIGEKIMRTVIVAALISSHLSLLFPPMQLNLQHTTLYRLTGIATLIVQFVTRILNWPLCILIYAAQYHDWDMVKAIHGLHSICIISMILWQVLETYWFMKIWRSVCVCGHAKNKMD